MSVRQPSPSEQRFIDALLWVRQWLCLLHKNGFRNTLAEIADALSGRVCFDTAATRILINTRHLSHPSLDALKDALDKVLPP